MKTILLSALFIVPSLVIGQVTIIDENFDNYNDQDWAGDVSSVMTTWSGGTGAGSLDDVLITNTESFSVSNSVMITGPQAGGDQDAIIQFPTAYTSGKYEFTMKYKVAAGMGGYFNLQSYTSGFGPSPDGYWMAEVQLAADGSGTMDAGGINGTTFNYSNGAWIDILIVCDLDLDEGHVFIDGSEIGTGFQWSLTTSGTDNISSFGAINLYSSSGDPVAACEYYVDDVKLVRTSTSAGVEENFLSPTLTIVPNPSEGNFVLNYADLAMENATVAVVDVLGKTIFSEKMNVLGKSAIIFDLNLRNGVYFVTISDANSKMTKKIIVRK